MNKIPSFSLVEMLVVLLLSSIVIAIIYFAYYTVSSYQMDLTKRYSRFNDRSQLYFLLKKDFERSSDCRNINGSSMLCYVPLINEEIRYTFSPDFIVRTQRARSDTFSLRSSGPIFLLEGQPSVVNTRIDELHLEIEDSALPTVIHLYKMYDKASLIETINDTLQ